LERVILELAKHWPDAIFDKGGNMTFMFGPNGNWEDAMQIRECMVAAKSAKKW